MLPKDPWLLPDGVDELLPEEARQVEHLRRTLLDLFITWGYEQVVTPFIDYLSSLLIGAGRDLDLQTFKLTDQLSGELLGIRADMTPQVARLDAHHLKRPWPTRLCYVGTVLHTRGDPLEKTRCPMQIGAEIYGHAGIESDFEVICLMLEMLSFSGILNVHLDLGHVGIYRALSRQAGLANDQEQALFDVLQRKANPELQELLTDFQIAEPMKTGFVNLSALNGDVSVLVRAKALFSDAPSEVKQALAELTQLAQQLHNRFPALPISFDLAELRGYNYHTGVVFAAFVPDLGREIARGGRYDNIGATFGRARPATGFSADLKILVAVGKVQPETQAALIFAPLSEDIALQETIRALRAQGRAVVQQLPGQSGSPAQLGCTAMLTLEQQSWVVTPLV